MCHHSDWHCVPVENIFFPFVDADNHCMLDLLWQRQNGRSQAEYNGSVEGMLFSMAKFYRGNTMDISL